jgi:DNA-binding MarR family transcriptional regulator
VADQPSPFGGAPETLLGVGALPAEVAHHQRVPGHLAHLPFDVVTFDVERYSVQKFDVKSFYVEGASMAETRDRKDMIDRFVEGAIRIYPSLEPEVEAAVDRMDKIAKYLDRTTERTVKVFGLNTGEFKLLLKLHQAPGQTMTAGALADRLDLSSSAITNRLDRLEEDGLITRERGTEDRRSVHVTITPRGGEVLAEAVERQAKVEKDFLGALTHEEQLRLNALLRTLILEIEDRGDAALLHHHEAAQSDA